VILERDKKYVWHPYTQHGLDESLFSAQSAHGSYITLENGQKILDGISSWWVNLHGHGRPEIVAAISNQAQTLEHVVFAGFTHGPAVELAQILVTEMKEKNTQIEKVFYSDNGSTAVEVALKMAYQYHINVTGKPRPKFLALHGSYHGDTFGAMSVGEPSGFHTKFKDLLPRVDFIQPDDFKELEEAFSENSKEYAAIIVEPMVQGAGGMLMHSAEYLKRISELCLLHNVLLICDEVFTGFYRTGKAFAFEHAELKPDLICVSKGITGGFLPLAATLTTDKIFKAFKGNEVAKAFLHGHSYTANPISCAAAVASWKILKSNETQDNIINILELTEKNISELRKNPLIKDARALGTIGAVTMKFDFDYMSGAGSWFKRRAIEKGVLLRPLGPVLYGVPPYCVTEAEVNLIYKTITDLVNEYGESQ
jgi:adenosylmethionine-8-amino-7-oxononanoate aminotransferase